MSSDSELKLPSAMILPTEGVNGNCSGATELEFSVSGDGSAEISVPLWVPPGRNGMQPNLALTYSNKGRDGWLGVGWSLSGLLAIVRAPKSCDCSKSRERQSVRSP